MYPQPADCFTHEAAREWKKIPKAQQEMILANVWCGQCLGAVRMVLESAKMENGNLVLQGKCVNCRKTVCRVVERE